MKPPPVSIGQQNEGALHRALKAQLALPGDVFEQSVDGYIVDIVRGDTLIEVQTGSFSPLRKKLADLVERHDVVLVAPVPVVRTIVRLDDDGAELSRRRSPKTGRLIEIADRLVSVTGLMGHPRFTLEVVLTHETERRVFAAGRAWRRRGWVIVGRELDAIAARHVFRGPHDLLSLLPAGLPTPCTTADVAAAARGCGCRARARGVAS